MSIIVWKDFPSLFNVAVTFYSNGLRLFSMILKGIMHYFIGYAISLFERKSSESEPKQVYKNNCRNYIFICVSSIQDSQKIF